MTEKELKELRELAQQCCDVWANILGLHQWSIYVEVVDGELTELPEPDYNSHIAAAKVVVPTGDAWKSIYKDFWAPYSMEAHIISQLLNIMGIFPEASMYHLARVLAELKNRGDILQKSLEEKQTEQHKELEHGEEQSQFESE